MKEVLLSPVREATLDALERAFSELFDEPCRRSADAGPLLSQGFSPGPLERSVVDEEEGMLSVAALRELGWPLDAEEAGDEAEAGDARVPFRLLPWLGTLRVHEFDRLLTRENIERAPELLLQPNAASTLADRRYSGRWYLSPERWALFSLALSGGDFEDRREGGAALLGLRRLADEAGTLAVVVLPAGEWPREAILALLGIDEAALGAASAGNTAGLLAYL